MIIRVHQNIKKFSNLIYVVSIWKKTKNAKKKIISHPSLWSWPLSYLFCPGSKQLCWACLDHVNARYPAPVPAQGPAPHLTGLTHRQPTSHLGKHHHTTYRSHHHPPRSHRILSSTPRSLAALPRSASSSGESSWRIKTVVDTSVWNDPKIIIRSMITILEDNNLNNFIIPTF